MDGRKELLQQTGIVALGEALGVAAMIGIFALLGAFDMRVLWGGLVGGLVAVANFFVMAIGVNIAADKAKNQDVKGGQAAIKGSYALRMALMIVVLAIPAVVIFGVVLAMRERLQEIGKGEIDDAKRY